MNNSSTVRVELDTTSDNSCGSTDQYRENRGWCPVWERYGYFFMDIFPRKAFRNAVRNILKMDAIISVGVGKTLNCNVCYRNDI
jgi:hypothetical protein